MKRVKLAIAGAICLIALGITGVFVLGWRQSQAKPVQQQVTSTSKMTSSSEDKTKRPTEPNLKSVIEESLVRLADSEEDMTLKATKNSKKTNQLPDVTDGKVLRQSLFDFAAIQKGDFSSVAGTWQDGYGNIIVIDKDGKLTETTAFKMTAVKNGILSGEYREDDTGYGASAQFIPAGIDASVQITGGAVIYDASDVSQDKIWLGDSWASLADPYIFYYRVTDEQAPE